MILHESWPHEGRPVCTVPRAAWQLKIALAHERDTKGQVRRRNIYTSQPLQGGLVPNKISGVGTNFGLLVHVLPGPNKQRALKPSMLLS